MNFITWIFRRIKNSQSDWARGYHRLILEETFLSIVFTLICGILLYIVPVAFLLIPYVDREVTAVRIIWGLVASVVLFYVYHWIMALHEVYEAEKQKIWEALK
jgi:TM2 domain-containing membrane protein YozV